MAILSEFEEEEQQPQQKPTPAPKPAPTLKPFSATLDSSNSLGFLQSAFQFVSSESDFFADESSVNAVTDLAKKIREKYIEEVERKKKKKANESAVSASSSSVAASTVSKTKDSSPMDEDKVDSVKDDEKEAEKSKYAGLISLSFSSIFIVYSYNLILYTMLYHQSHHVFLKCAVL